MASAPAVARPGALQGRLLASVLALAVSAGILWWLLASAHLQSLQALLARASLWHLALAFLLVPVIQGLRAWRFSILLLGRNSAPPWPMFVVAVRLIVFNLLLPFKLGEATFPVMARRAFGTAISHSVGALALVRLLDFSVVAALVLLGAAAALPDGTHPPDWLLMIGGLLLLSLTLVMPRLLGALRRVAWRLGWRLADRFLESAVMLEQTTPRVLVVVSTLAIWIAQALVGWLAATAAVRGIGLAATTFAAASANFAFALPVPTIGGLGPSQAAWVMALDLAATPWNAAVASALACHVVLLTGALTLWGLTWVTRIWLPAPGTAGPAGAY